MDTISLGVLGVIAFFVLFGFIFGIARGFKSSILRLVMLIVIAVLLVVFKDNILKAVLSINIEGATLQQLIDNLIADFAKDSPEIGGIINQLVPIVYALFALILVWVAYILASIVSMIIFWILKAIFRTGRGKKRRLIGGLIGILQGIMIAYLVLVPVVGLTSQVAKLDGISFATQTTTTSTSSEPSESTMATPFAIPKEIIEFNNSPIGKILVTAGKPYIDVVATAKNSAGEKITLNAQVDAVAFTLKTASSFMGLASSLGNMEELTTDSVEDIKEELLKVREDKTKLNEESVKAFQNLVNAAMSSLEMDLPIEIDAKNFEHQIDSIVFTVDLVATVNEVSQVDFSNGLNDDNVAALENALRDISDKKEGLSDKAQEATDDLFDAILDMAGEGAPIEMPEDVNFADINFATEADAIREVYDLSQGEDEVNVETLVNSLAESTLLLPMIESSDVVVRPSAEMKAEIKAALNGIEDADKVKAIKKLFGIA